MPQIVIGEAIEEEMGHDEVVLGGLKLVRSGISTVEAHVDGIHFCDSRFCERDHLSAGLHGINSYQRGAGQQAAQEPTVPIPKDQPAFRGCNIPQKGQPTLLQSESKYRPFTPTVPASDQVAVHLKNLYAPLVESQRLLDSFPLRKRAKIRRNDDYAASNVLN